MILLLIALFGLTVPNGLFIYWVTYEYNGIGPVLQNKLAMGFVIEAFVMLGLLSYYFARNPIGKIKWYWFVVLSLIGGLGFGLPLYWWMNKREIG